MEKYGVDALVRPTNWGFQEHGLTTHDSWVPLFGGAPVIVTLLLTLV